MGDVVKLSDRRKAEEEKARKAAAEQRHAGGNPTNRAKLPLLLLSIAIVLLGIFWEPVLHTLSTLFGRG